MTALACVLAVSGGAAAFGAWNAAVDTGGHTDVPATTMPSGPVPTPTLSGDDVTLGWGDVTTPDGHPVEYEVERTGSSGVPLPASGGCGGRLASSGCVEADVPEGRWSYRVQPRLGTQWRGTQSTASVELVVDVTAPVNQLSLLVADGGAAQSGTTTWYRGAAAGSLLVRNDLTDTLSGPASSTTSALSGGAGFSHDPGPVSSPVGGPYVSAPISWAAGTSSSPTVEVLGTDVSGNTATTTLTLRDDSTGPVAGSLEQPGGAISGRTVSLSWSGFSDDQSGIDTQQLQRSLAELRDDGTCAAFGAWRDRGSLTAGDTGATDPAPVGSCARYRLVVTDRVGNATTVEGGATTLIGYTETVASTADVLGRWRLDETLSVVIDSQDFFGGTTGQDLSAYDPTWRTDLGQAAISADDTVYRSSPNSAVVAYDQALPVADYTVLADLRTRSVIDGELVGLSGRTTGTDGYTAFYDTSDQTVRLWKVVSGQFNPVAEATSASPIPPGTKQRMAMQFEGSRIRVYLDGVLLIDATDGTYAGPGRAGMSWAGLGGVVPAASDTTGVHLDDYLVIHERPAVDSGGDNDGVYGGSPTLGVPGAIASSTRTAVSFDGTDDVVRVDREVADDFSIELWFRSTQGLGDGQGWSTGAGLVDADVAGLADDFGVSLTADGRVQAGVGNAGGDTTLSSTPGHDDGEWHHVVFTRVRSSGALRLYVDGALVAGPVTGPTTTLAASASLDFGRSSTGQRHFTGSLDEISVYGAALGAGQVADRYETGTAAPADLTGPTGGGVAALGLGGTGGRYTTSTSVDVAFFAGNDPSGLSPTRLLTRTSAPMTNGTCGAYGSPVTVATDPTDEDSPVTDVVEAGRCHQYALRVEDTEGNYTTFTSGAVKVDTTAPPAPTVQVTASGATSRVLPFPLRIVYNPTRDGSFTLAAGRDDPESGIASWTFPTLGSGWTGGGERTTRTADYTWTAGPAEPPASTVTSRGNQGVVSPASSPIQFLPDSAPPTGGSLSYPGGTTHGTSVTLTHDAGSDSPAGIGSRRLEDRVAVYSDGECVLWSGWSVLSNGFSPVGPTTEATVDRNLCYEYRYRVTDRVGNEAVTGNGDVVRALDLYTNQVAATPGLLDYWRLGDGYGTATAVEQTGDNPGEYRNGAVSATQGPPAGPQRGTTGALVDDADTAVTFDGVDDSMRAGNWQVGVDVSLELWFRTTQTDGGTSSQWNQNARLMDTTEDKGQASTSGVSLTSDGSLVAGVARGTSTWSVSSPPGYNDGEWHHLVFTRDNEPATISLYLDGELVGSNPGGAMALNDAVSMVFGASTAGTQHFEGSLDEIATYDVVLPPGTVRTHYDSR